MGPFHSRMYFQNIIEVDAETKEMLNMMNFQSILGLQMTTVGQKNRSKNSSFTEASTAPTWRNAVQEDVSEATLITRATLTDQLLFGRFPRPKSAFFGLKSGF